MKRVEIMTIALASGIVKTSTSWAALTMDIEKFAVNIAAAEREACAKVCEKQDGLHDHIYAEAIRARGEQ